MGKLTHSQAQHLARFYADVMGWGERGLMTVLEQCATDGSDPRSVALALARISLDDHMDGPGILPQHGQHWRDTPVGSRPEKPKCLTHGQPHPCHGCLDDPQIKPLDDPKSWRAQVRIEREQAAEARRQMTAEQAARRDAARHEAARKKAQQLDAARAELHQGDQP